MKDYALELTAKQSGTNAKVNTLREYLQAYALRVMGDAGVFRTTAFLGGTALRFLHGLPRFSEDLDFSLTQPSGPSGAFVELVKNLKREFTLAGYDVSAVYKDEKTVQSAFLRFDHLLFEAGISPHKDQKLSIKIEVDTNPPEGAVLRTSIVNKYFPISFLAYDLSSLLAGKTHALLNRRYTKGRDFFDLGWYLSRWKDLSPNMILLTNALKQTGWTAPFPDESNWKQYLSQVITRADWDKVRQDVENFLETPRDQDIFTKTALLGLLE